MRKSGRSTPLATAVASTAATISVLLFVRTGSTAIAPRHSNTVEALSFSSQAVHPLFSRASRTTTAAATSPSSPLLSRKNSSRASGSRKDDSSLHAKPPDDKKRQGNPFAAVVGDMASSIFSAATGGNAQENVDSETKERIRSELDETFGTSWEDVRSELTSRQTEEEKGFRADVEAGVGVASPLNKIRLYDGGNKEEDIRVTFYRDSASWCPYCHKIWLCLEEKRIPYRVEKVNMSCYGTKPQSFLQLQPSGQIPVAKIDDTVYRSSDAIIYALEREFPDSKPLIPKETDVRATMRLQAGMRLERNLFSVWLTWLTGNGGERAKAAFRKVLNEVEKELNDSKGDFFLGKDVTLLDFLYAPFLERTAASLLFFKGFQIRVAPGADTDYPAVNRWFDAMEGLESYRLTKSDYYTHCWDLPPQLGGCSYEDGGGAFEQAINGVRRMNGTGGSWEYPLDKDNGGVEPDWGWCGDDGAARREAVERLSYNHEGIVKFATRGAGRKGMPAYGAALSDPNAVGNDGVQDSVDACLRLLSLSLLKSEEGEGGGDETLAANMDQLAKIVVEVGGKEYADGVVASLVYLRDRVGVPRDMRLPAARHLRAQLNWGIEKILVRMDSS